MYPNTQVRHQPHPSWRLLRLPLLSGLSEPPLSWLLASSWTVTYSQAVCFQRPLSTCSQHTEESLSLSLPGIPPHHSHTQALAYSIYAERTSYISDTGPDLEHTAVTSRHRTLECGWRHGGDPRYEGQHLNSPGFKCATQYPAPSSVWGSRLGSVSWLMRRKQVLASHSCAHSAFH